MENRVELIIIVTLYTFSLLLTVTVSVVLGGTEIYYIPKPKYLTRYIPNCSYFTDAFLLTHDKLKCSKIKPVKKVYSRNKVILTPLWSYNVI